ncbi:variable surface protein [Plasmodium gonderi]|uniref:Variable surface protein n=1 Tax=Plasmodium gonderi TaxID=77519 RepID=A0A1Y1JNT6_PLAGO|nr:variable surface protein [Plasmodium gonderi]GAW83920.1 variable surface protein [Plasmodium gonderi]
MGESIYDVLKKFPECKNNVDEYSTNWSRGEGGTWKELCDENGKELLLNKLIHEENKSKSICTQAMRYLVDVNSAMGGSLYEAGLEYLYYWVYDILHKNVHTDITLHVEDVYNELFHLFRDKFKRMDESNIIRLNSLENRITKIDFPKFRVIYDKYNKIISHSLSNDEVFQEILDIIIKYNQIEYQSSKINTSTMTTPCKSNTIVPIMITFIVTYKRKRITIKTQIFLMHIFLMSQFTKYGSWFRQGILWKRNHWDSPGEENNMFEIPEISSSSLKDIKYNIYYNYP